MSLNEAEIKASLLQCWRGHRIVTKENVVASEYVLGSNSRRVDLAFSGSQLVGVEIKSDFDSLDRLKDQIAVYEHCFDKVIVACGSRHLDYCLAFLPDHVDVWGVDGRSEPKMMRQAIRAAEQNLIVMAKSLTVAQLKHLLSDSEPNRSRVDLVERASQLPRHVVRQAHLEFFNGRFAKSSKDFWRSLGRRKITSGDIASLSRFAEIRNRRLEVVRARKEFWVDWQHSASLTFS